MKALSVADREWLNAVVLEYTGVGEQPQEEGSSVFVRSGSVHGKVCTLNVHLIFRIMGKPVLTKDFEVPAEFVRRRAAAQVRYLLSRYNFPCQWLDQHTIDQAIRLAEQAFAEALDDCRCMGSSLDS